MIDVQKISSTLEQLSDQGLQQYAQMHKEDPYTLAMAVSESSRRQRMRQAAQAPQPAGAGTVADEALSEMAPPPVAGLGAAADAAIPPAQGFADGGDVQLYRDPRIAGLVAGRGDTSAEEELRLLPAFWRALQEGKTVAQVRAEQNAGKTSVGPVAAPANPNYENEPRREAPFWGPTAQPAPTPPAAGLAQAADVVLPPARGGSAGGIGISRTSSGPSGGAPQLDVDPDTLYADAEKQTRAATDAARTNAQQSETELQAEQAARGKLGAGREARIRAEQEGMAGKEAQAKRDALLQAGFAILSADPSKGAWSAIGTGALQGLQGYKGDMASLAKRREELVNKIDELDTLRRQEATADSRELRGIRSQIRQVEVDGAKALAAIGGEKAKLGADLKVSAFKELSATYRSERENATRMAAARVSAAAGSRNQQLEVAQAYAKSAGIPLDRAIQEISQGKRAPVDVMAGYNDWAKANPMLAMGDPAKAVGAYLATSGALKAATQAVRVTDRPTGQLLSR